MWSPLGGSRVGDGGAMEGWLNRRPWTGAAVVLLLVAAVAWHRTQIERPRLDRDWEPHLALMPVIEAREDAFHLALATDWSYTPEGPAERNYTSFAARHGDLRNVWFVIEPHPGFRPMAHTLVLFEFAGDRVIGLTIEARRERTEDYSALAGAFNAFELAYIWSTPRDLLTRRAVMLAHDVFVYPLALDEGQKRRFLDRLIRETQEVSTTPRFYNTLVSNCTNELAKLALLDWHPSWVLTGYSTERLYELGLIPSEGKPFADVRALARLTDDARDWAALDAASFDAALLAELRRRFPSSAGARAAAATARP